jgi:hypothetical protein
VGATNIPADAVLYQWQVEAPGSNQWVSIPGAILSTYQNPQVQLADNGAKYRVVATVPGGPSVTSAAATLSVSLPAVGISVANGMVTLTWTSGTLQEAVQLAGPWQDVTNATSPFSIVPTGSQMFFRSR